MGLDYPFEAMARSYTELFIVRGEEFKAGYLKAKCADYGIDGIIYHDAKTCPNNSNCRYGMTQRLARARLTVVDATNLILMEMGHPMHAFDYDRLRDRQIVVRLAEPNERAPR